MHRNMHMDIRPFFAKAILRALACMGLTIASPLAAEEVGDLQCRGAQGYSGEFDGRRTFLWRPQWIEALGSDSKRRAELVEEADAALARGPYSVTHKGKLVPGASPHDYTSIGPYWWPDPRKSDGLPYVRRDGQVNPERDGADFDKDRLRRFGRDMKSLALGYYLTDDPRYANHAAELVRTWFLDPATRMAPTMTFAQGIPGRVNGRGEGIIEASDLSTVIESIGLLEPSGALSGEEQRNLRLWFAQFANWMATSDNGLDEMAKQNNHGVFYDFYLSHFALYAGLEGVTRNIATNFPAYRLGQQMDRQGRFMAELSRTRSWHYSNFVVAGATRLATIAECVDVDLWAATLEDGRGLDNAKIFLDKYSGRLEAWPFPDQDKAAGELDKMQQSAEVVRLLYGRTELNGPPSELP